MGGDQLVEKVVDTGSRQLQLKAVAMGVGNQYACACLGPKCVQEAPYSRALRDQVLDFPLEGANVYLEFCRPKFGAVPLDGVTSSLEAAVKIRDSQVDIDPVVLGIAQW